MTREELYTMGVLVILDDDDDDDDDDNDDDDELRGINFYDPRGP